MSEVVPATPGQHARAQAVPLASASRGFWEASFRRFLKNRLGIAALVGLIILVGLSFSAPLIAQTRGLDRDAIELLDNYKTPNAKHWFGTDEFGRDYFIRVLYGGQISILMGLAVTVVVLVIAIPFGMSAAYFGGLFDDAFNWVVQLIVTLPTFFILILVASWIPPTPLLLALVIGLFGWTGNGRQARGLTLQIKQADYVLAAQALGAHSGRIIFRHVMPNIMSLMIVLAGFDVVAGVFAETTLSFLGLGIRPPLPSWGNMLTNSLNYVFKAPYLIVFPVAAIGLFVLTIYMLADALRDAFDPRLSR